MPARLSIALGLLVFGFPLSAQSWDSLNVLKPGDHVAIQYMDGKESHGSFKAVTPEAVMLTSETVERARVRRVKVRAKSRRLRNALIGAAIGVALGAVIDGTVGAYMRNEVGESGSVRVAGYALPIAAFAGIGAALPGYRTVYRAR